MMTERTVVSTCARAFGMELTRSVVVELAFITVFALPSQIVFAKLRHICDNALFWGGASVAAASSLVLALT